MSILTQGLQKGYKINEKIFIAGFQYYISRANARNMCFYAESLSISIAVSL
ncbi:hypothetical protein KL86DYS1_11115 [uncultured Dysgonomonas sp.]|uniref:Uncharacterized protein n=1 Tax=uncultured Dysgonomonas sp. TaxID=206096 RepID=A0A212J5B0_9BACT|nr:hypothetical protein KL86DYS1_11115 [uncultured Dysgonomonas sp.]